MSAIPQPLHPSLESDHAGDHGHAGHHEIGFLKKYIYSGDHKIIGIQFLFLGMMFFVVGGLLAMLVRWQLAWPDDQNHAVPILAKYLGWEKGIMPPDFYTMAFSMHATIMIFFVIIPLLVGTFGNYLIPLKIGAADMAFPFLNAMAFWSALPAGAIMVAGFMMPGGHAAAGWTVYPPLSAVVPDAAKKVIPYTGSKSDVGAFIGRLRISMPGAQLSSFKVLAADGTEDNKETFFENGETKLKFTGTPRVILDAANAAAASAGITNASFRLFDPDTEASGGVVNKISTTEHGLAIKVGDGDDAAGQKILSGIKKAKMLPGFESGWPNAALVTTYLAIFLCFGLICAYYVRLGSTPLNVLVSLLICAIAAFYTMKGVQYAAFDGQSCWFLSLIILGFSSIMGAVNYLTTIVKLRCPGMTMFRMPLSVWSLFITSVLVLLATPVLASVLTMNLLDHHRLTSFFEPFNWLVSNAAQTNPGGTFNAVHGGGGFVLLHQHLFWFYSHPAVYIMILPAMGMVSDIIAVFARKPIFGYRPMVYAMAGIAFLGFIVWAHHMFQTGMNPTLGTTFAISTMFIAVPSAIKTFNWLGTLWGANIRFTAAMWNALAFVSMFVIGGLSGIFMASTAVDVHIHDTYFIVAHIHYVLFGGTMFGVFGSLYFWYPKMFGRMMNETLGKIHFFISFIAFNCTFFPMHILGIGGMPRRVANPYLYDTFKHFQHMNQFITISAFVLGIGQIPFAINFIGSWIWGKKAPNNPWDATTLEWNDTTSPPPHGNFTKVPVVHHGPYEYSSPLVEEDWLPQTRYVEGAEAMAHVGH